MTSGTGAAPRPAPAATRLLAAAVGGDDQAFRELTEPHRRRLAAHCYRMLGSLEDAEDAVQEALLRAWRGLAGFDGRSAIGSWLHRIATTTCLNQIRGRPPRALPIDAGFASGDPADAAGPPLAESLWIDPFPDDWPGLADPRAGVERRYEHHERLELAYVAALQHLPGNQRAALLLTEVLDFSAKEAAETLDTTTASLNSALQRARETVARRVPDPSRQPSPRVLDDAAVGETVERFVAALERADVGAVVAQLTQDATWSMPPQPAWFRGRETIAAFLTEHPLRWFRWRLRPTHANGQPTVAAWSWDEGAGAFLPHSINVLEFRGPAISAVTSFLDVTRRGVEGPDFRSFLQRNLFARFGLPDRIGEHDR